MISYLSPPLQPRKQESEPEQFCKGYYSKAIVKPSPVEDGASAAEVASKHAGALCTRMLGNRPGVTSLPAALALEMPQRESWALSLRALSH